MSDYSGHRPTSTRTECIGLIGSILSSQPTHTALDNLACVLKATQYSQGNYAITLPKKPWGKIPDGDLSNIVHDYIHEKGAHAFAISKALGHATKADIEAGTCTMEEKEINDISDELAQIGRRTGDNASILAEISNMPAKRQRKYSFRIHCLLTVYVRVLKADDELRNALTQTRPGNINGTDYATNLRSL